MIKATLQLLTGSGIAAALGLATLPLLTKLYSPDSFGTLQLFQNLLLYGLVYSSFRYEVALLTIDETDIEDMIMLCGTLTALTSIVTIALCLFVNSEFGAAKNLPLLLWLPAALVVASLCQVFNYQVQRGGDFIKLSQAKVAQAGAAATTGIFVGALGFGSSGLIVADFIGRLTYFARVFPSPWRRHPFSMIKIRGERIFALLAKHRSLPVYAVPGGLLNVAGGTLTSVLMFAVFSPAFAGQFYLAEKVVLLPFGLIAAAVSQVYSSKLASLVRQQQNKSRQLFWKTVAIMGALGVLPCLTFLLFSGKIFSLFFGSEWLIAGLMAQSLCFLMVANLMTTPVNMTIMVAGNQQLQFLWELIRLGLMISAWYFIKKYGLDALNAVQIHVVISVIVNAIFLYMADSELRVSGATARVMKS